MSYIKPFQRATIQCVIKALRKKNGVRRFLVADEVGLGKTIVARGVISQLMHRHRSDNPLRVFYVCSSLAIAAQNKSSLLKVIDDSDDRNLAACDVDRLTLVLTKKPSNNAPLHLYLLTPNTSIPDRKGMRRSGTARERALLHNLLVSLGYEDLTRQKGKDWLCRNAFASWKSWKESVECEAPRSLASSFLPMLRQQLKLKRGQHLRPTFTSILRQDPLEILKIMRVSLGMAGLSELSPDLVIFDEFQRFQDLLDDTSNGSAIARELVRIGHGGQGSAVLLLSATPYRLYKQEVEQFFENADDQQQFFNLVEWLYGGDAKACQTKLDLQELFRNYGELLRTAEVGKAIEIKEDIEKLLCPIMARTERFSHEGGRDAAELQQVQASLRREDLEVFDHMVRCRVQNSRNGGNLVAYWSSVPFPLQTLGPSYKTWQSAKRTPPRKKTLRLLKDDADKFRRPSLWPHPKLRSMLDYFRPENLSLPWMPPSLPWWQLRGKWAENSTEKALVFSRFRAVPRTLAGLISYELERYLLRSKYRTSTKVDKIKSGSILRSEQEDLAFFHPSFALASLIDPHTFKSGNLKQLKRQALDQLRLSLAQLGIKVQPNKQKRSLPILMIQLERRLGVWGNSFRAWLKMLKIEDAGRSNEGNGRSLGATLSRWNSRTYEELQFVSPQELVTLANAALSSPGSIIARCMLRQKLANRSSLTSISIALKVSWTGLRSYFNNPWIHSSLTGNGNYRTRIAHAIVHGNLESVLDEHLWVTSTLRNSEPQSLLEDLTTALTLRTSNIKVYGYDRSDFNLRSHVVLAFNEAVRRYTPGQDESDRDTFRSEDVRIAFNSPFWPHILTTTSVGQEGLDFHSWCSSVVHWDLPGNPVDLEQREGRVDRYAGLSMRRALAEREKVGLSSDSLNSPWKAIADQAVQHPSDSSGLAPWWVMENKRIKRFVFDVPLSEAAIRFENLRRQRVLYRLTLGQPDQADLIDALQNRISDKEALDATINLSPFHRS